jgi:CRISPR-associated protein Csm4
MGAQSWNITGERFHFGQHGLGQEETLTTLPSDSLFAALVARLALAQGRTAVDQFMEPFLLGKPPFVLTSCFPFAGEVRFFPTPLTAYRSGEADGPVRVKDLKKVRYVSEAIFNRLLHGEKLGNFFAKAVPLQDGAILAAAEDQKHLPSGDSSTAKLWSTEKRPRVAIDRATNFSNIYFTGQVTFAAGCGLWFATRWLEDSPAFQKQVADLLADLAAAGLGGERSSGFGACKITPAAEVELPEAPAKAWVSLSRYLPARDELHALRASQACYSLERVGGWLESPGSSGQRRRSLNLVVEGSVLGPLDALIPGRVVDVRPRYETNPDPLGHPVYRSGLSFAVGMQGGGS